MMHKRSKVKLKRCQLLQDDRGSHSHEFQLVLFERYLVFDHSPSQAETFQFRFFSLCAFLCGPNITQLVTCMNELFQGACWSIFSVQNYAKLKHFHQWASSVWFSNVYEIAFIRIVSVSVVLHCIGKSIHFHYWSYFQDLLSGLICWAVAQILRCSDLIWLWSLQWLAVTEMSIHSQMWELFEPASGVVDWFTPIRRIYILTSAVAFCANWWAAASCTVWTLYLTMKLSN